MKVVIDDNRCSGHGRCYMLVPELFIDDDAGYGKVVGDGTVGHDHSDAAERAVAACPEKAITIAAADSAPAT